MSTISNIGRRTYDEISKAVGNIAINFPLTTTICVLATAALAFLTFSLSFITLTIAECVLLYPHVGKMHKVYTHFRSLGINECDCSIEKEAYLKTLR